MVDGVYCHLRVELASSLVSCLFIQRKVNRWKRRPTAVWIPMALDGPIQLPQLTHRFLRDQNPDSGQIPIIAKLFVLFALQTQRQYSQWV